MWALLSDPVACLETHILCVHQHDASIPCCLGYLSKVSLFRLLLASSIAWELRELQVSEASQELPFLVKVLNLLATKLALEVVEVLKLVVLAIAFEFRLAR